MKKFLLLVMTVLLLTGCGKVEKFYLEEEIYNGSTVEEINISKLKSKINSKDNFALFVYLPGCTSCAEFASVLETFTKDNKIEIYSISILDVDTTNIRDYVEYAPSLILYKKGEIVEYLDSTSDIDIPALTTVDGLKKWLDKYIYLEK